MSVKSSTELMLYVVLTMPTLNKAYLFIYLFIILNNNVSRHKERVQYASINIGQILDFW
jgi:hypothetical protein